jgi:hypothetical protein
MNSSPKRASGPAGKSHRKDANLDLATAREMLPYVRSIVTDVVQTAETLKKLNPVQEMLEDTRRSLDWKNRQRRYSIQDEIRSAEDHLAEAVSELDSLGVRIVDTANGAVDFPTRIHNRPAAFSWQLGEDSLRFWHYAEEPLRRPIPLDWHASGTLSRYQS